MSLESMRKSSEKLWAKILIGLLLFSFVGWGAADYILSSGRDVGAGMVGRAKISYGEFDRARSDQMHRLSMAQQGEIYSNPNVRAAFNRAVLTSLASQKMVAMHADKIGLGASDARVADIIKSTKEFQDGGEFNTSKFMYLISRVGLDPDSYGNMIRAQLVGDMTFAPAAISGMVSRFAVDAMFMAHNAARNIEFATFKYSDFKISGQPTEEQIAQTYASNPIRVPEYRTASYAFVDVKNMSDPDASEKGHKKIIEIENDIFAGTPLKDAAAKHGGRFVRIDAIDVGGVYKDGRKTTDPVLNAGSIGLEMIFRTDQGNETEIIETKQGFAIIRVEKIEPAGVKPLESVRSEMAKIWREKQQEMKSYEAANAAVTGAKNGKSVGKTVKVSRVSGAPLEVLNAAFATKPGWVGVVPGNGQFFAVRVIGEAGTPKMTEKDVVDMRVRAATALAESMSIDFENYLRTKYPVKINEKMMER